MELNVKKEIIDLLATFEITQMKHAERLVAEYHAGFTNSLTEAIYRGIGKSKFNEILSALNEERTINGWFLMRCELCGNETVESSHNDDGEDLNCRQCGKDAVRDIPFFQLDNSSNIMEIMSYEMEEYGKGETFNLFQSMYYSAVGNEEDIPFLLNLSDQILNHMYAKEANNVKS